MSDIAMLTEIWHDRRQTAVRAQHRLRDTATAAFDMSPVASLAPTRADRDLYRAAQAFVNQMDLARAAQQGLCAAADRAAALACQVAS